MAQAVLAMAQAADYDVYALSFRYGQRHAFELDCAAALAQKAGVPHVVLDLNLSQFGGSALTADIAVPKDRDDTQMAGDIPVTYVPARNTVFLVVCVGLGRSA